MKLLCIDASPLPNKQGGLSTGNHLVEGQTYTCDGSIYIANGDKCYIIDELAHLDYPYKRIERFVELSELDELALVNELVLVETNKKKYNG